MITEIRTSIVTKFLLSSDLWGLIDFPSILVLTNLFVCCSKRFCSFSCAICRFLISFFSVFFLLLGKCLSKFLNTVPKSTQ